MKKQRYQETTEAHMRESCVLDATQKGTTPKHAKSVWHMLLAEIHSGLKCLAAALPLFLQHLCIEMNEFLAPSSFRNGYN